MAKSQMAPPSAHHVRYVRLNALHVLLVLLLFSLWAPPIQSIPTGIGSSANDGCLCHGSQSNQTTTSLIGLPDTYESNQSYAITLAIDSMVEQTENAAQGGFRLRIDQGSIVFENQSHAQILDDGWTHTLAGNQQRIWNFTWISPLDNQTTTTFTAHGNAVNGNENSMGDVWNSFQLTIPGAAYTGEVVQPEVVIFEYSNFTVILIGLSVMFLLLYFAVR
ncbi:MAG: hypothetical protein CMA63_05085 [Euryarchaeota archaeon]|nr:hypothetical protein [Euryarchaeota archaeon]